MPRLSPLPIIRGHWKGLSQRDYGSPEEPPTVTPDRVAQVLTIGVPLATAITILAVPPVKGIDIGVAVGLGLAWSALTSAGLLGAFTLLAGWRARLSDRQAGASYLEVRQRPLLALVDEAVAHVMVGVIDALMVAVFTVAAALAGHPLTRPLMAVAAAAAAHTVFLFGLMVTRLYSAYTQVEHVRDEVNGFVP